MTAIVQHERAEQRRERMLAAPNFRDGRFHNPTGKTPGLKSGERWGVMREYMRAKPRTPPGALPMVDPLGTWRDRSHTGLRATWLSASASTGPGRFLRFEGKRDQAQMHPIVRPLAVPGFPPGQSLQVERSEAHEAGGVSQVGGGGVQGTPVSAPPQHGRTHTCEAAHVVAPQATAAVSPGAVSPGAVSPDAVSSDAVSLEGDPASDAPQPQQPIRA